MDETQVILKESAEELHDAADVTIALAQMMEETDEVKKSGLLSDFHATVASRLDLTVFHSLTTQEWITEGHRNSQQIFMSLEDTVTGLRPKGKLDPLPPTVWGSLSGLHDKLAEVEETLEAVGEMVMALENKSLSVSSPKSGGANFDSEEKLNISVDNSTGSNDLFFQAIKRRPGEPDPVQVEPGVIQGLEKRVTVLEKRDKFDSSQIVVVRDHVL